MSFSPSDFLDLARSLSQNPMHGLEEACQRSAVSRSYYAALLVAREKASDRSGVPYPTQANTHQWTIDHYLNDASPRVKSLGDKLRELHRRRKRADYDVLTTGMEQEARMAIATAGKLISDIGSLS